MSLQSYENKVYGIRINHLRFTPNVYPFNFKYCRITGFNQRFKESTIDDGKNEFHCEKLGEEEGKDPRKILSRRACRPSGLPSFDLVSILNLW